MSAPPDHRDVLLEIFGPDGGAIDRDGLVRALRASRLPEMLARQGAIDAAARARIEAWLEQRLGSRDGLPTDVTLRVVPDGHETDVFRGGGKTEGGAVPTDATTVDIILPPIPGRAASSKNGERRAYGDGDRNGDGAGKAERHGSEDGRFTVIEVYKEGGLGIVSIARDDELHREVAYKEIRPKYVNQADKRARFVAEAEITGGLEHPGIVPVYALGRDEQGRPFYAMKLIRGERLAEAVDKFRERGGTPSSKRAGLRDLIGRMIAVCDAIQYAHSRGVIHRDIKPINIMIGKYGETLVVDWGLAKVFGRKGRAKPAAGPSPASATVKPASSDELPFELHSDSADGETPPGHSVGTPGYMSPEQARGANFSAREDELNPRSDVYSLGATLYYVLTGQRSIVGVDQVDYLRRVEAGAFPAPHALDPTVPLALDAVCMKAMAVAPADRYASPDAMAADLKHWLADEPVSSYRDPFQARVFRWVRRHKPIVAGVLMFLFAAIGVLMSLIAAIVVLGASLGVIVGEKRRADANLARLGESAWASIERSLKDDSPIKVFAEGDESRGKLCDQSDAIFDLYLRQRPDDLPAIERAAIIAVAAANFHRLFGEEYPKARAQYDKAIRNFERLVKEAPEDLRFQDFLLKAYIDRTELSLAEERWNDVEADQQRVLRLTTEWPNWPLRRAWALQIRAKFLLARGRDDEASTAIDEAIGLLRPNDERPAVITPDYQERLMLIISLTTRARIASDRAKPEEARGAIDEAMRMLDILRSRWPDEPNAGNLRASLLNFLATIDASTPAGRPQAETKFQEAVDVARRLAKKYPEMKFYAMNEALSLLGLSMVRLSSSGSDLDAVASDLAAAGTILEAMRPSPSKVAEVDAEKGRLLVLRGKLDAARGNQVEARKKIAAGEAAMAGLLAKYPQNKLIRDHRDFARRALAEVDGASSPR